MSLNAVTKTGSSQGGPQNVQLPSSLTVSTFTAARTKEIQAMKKAISETSGTKMIFQKLPKHMRRRAMSHTVKRLPRRLREIHLNQMTKSGLPPKQKKPTRKFRRRPMNLLQDYIRRRRRVKWLYTHIWHAKRFQMVEKWGYKIPERPCDKAFRACYRATSKHCLIQDISYHECVEISGNYEKIVEIFIKITVTNAGLRIGAKCFQNGKRSGNVMIFEPENGASTIQKAIGEVKFLWNSNNNCLWLFIHPAYYSQVFQTILNVFDTKDNAMEAQETKELNNVLKDNAMDTEESVQILEIKMDQNETNELKSFTQNVAMETEEIVEIVDSDLEVENADKGIKKSKETEKSTFEKSLEIKKIVYSNKDNIQIKELNQEISTFRLTGPLANAVLQNAFNLPNFEAEKPKKRPEWLKETDNILEQSKYWTSITNISTTSELPPNMVLGLVVHDPRHNFPQKRTKSWPKSIHNDTLQDLNRLPQNLSASFLWNKTVRHYLEENKETNAKIAETRSKVLVPGTVLENSGELVPIILLQRPGVRDSENLGYASGWDLILPSSYAQSFWISLIMWGARAGGLRETNSINFECSKGDILPPDTLAGKNEDKCLSEQFKDKYFRLPPNKRTNYNKFGIRSPFNCDWTCLVKDWSTDDTIIEDYFVMRDKKILQEIQNFLTTKQNNPVVPLIPSNCLIPIKLKLSKKGKCKRYSIISLPKREDFKKEPLEPIFKDKYQKLRITTRKQHQNLLKRLSRRRKRARNKEQPIVPIDQQQLKNYQDKMRALWLPPAKSIRHSCSREIMGFIQNGDFSFSIGSSKATGYIVARSLEKLATLKFRNKVLVRNVNSRQYRIANFNVIFS